MRLRRAGGLQQYSYEWGRTNRLEGRLSDLRATVEKTSDQTTGLRVLTANFPDGPSMRYDAVPVSWDYWRHRLVNGTNNCVRFGPLETRANHSIGLTHANLRYHVEKRGVPH